MRVDRVECPSIDTFAQGHADQPARPRQADSHLGGWPQTPSPAPRPKRAGEASGRLAKKAAGSPAPGRNVSEVGGRMAGPSGCERQFTPMPMTATKSPARQPRRLQQHARELWRRRRQIVRPFEAEARPDGRRGRAPPPARRRRRSRVPAPMRFAGSVSSRLGVEIAGRRMPLPADAAAPAVCSPPTIHSMPRAPAPARSRATALVEPTVSRNSTRWPDARRQRPGADPGGRGWGRVGRSQANPRWPPLKGGDGVVRNADSEERLRGIGGGGHQRRRIDPVEEHQRRRHAGDEADHERASLSKAGAASSKYMTLTMRR